MASAEAPRMDDEHDRYDQAVREALEAAAALIQATAAEAESLRRGSSSGSVPPPSHRPPPRLHNHKRLHVNQYQCPQRIWLRPYAQGSARIRTREFHPPRDDPRVKAVFSLLWTAATSGASDDALMDREQYVIVSMKLFKALYELWNESDARRVAEEEWHRNVGTSQQPHGAAAGISRRQFEAGLFALVEAWSVGSDAQVFATFLYQLFDQVARGSAEAGFVWREYEDIEFAGFQLGAFTSTWGVSMLDSLEAGKVVAHRSPPSPPHLQSARPTVFQLPPADGLLLTRPRSPSPAKSGRRHCTALHETHVGEVFWRRAATFRPLSRPEKTKLARIDMADEWLKNIKEKQYDAPERQLQQLRHLESVGSSAAARHARSRLQEVEQMVKKHLNEVLQRSKDAALAGSFAEARAHVHVVEDAVAQLPSLNLQGMLRASAYMRVFCRRITLALKAQSVADAASQQVSLQARVAGHTRGKTGVRTFLSESRIHDGKWGMEAHKKVTEADARSMDAIRHQDVAEGSAMIRLGEEKQRDRAPEVRAPKGDLVKLHIRMPEVRQDGMRRGLFRASASSTAPALAPPAQPAPRPLAWKPQTEVLEEDEEEPLQRPAVAPATFEDVAPAGSTASSVSVAGGPAATEASDLGGRGVTMGARTGAMSAPPYQVGSAVFRPVSTVARAASP
jgi:hypothetical protein